MNNLEYTEIEEVENEEIEEVEDKEIEEFMKTEEEIKLLSIDEIIKFTNEVDSLTRKFEKGELTREEFNLDMDFLLESC